MPQQHPLQLMFLEGLRVAELGWFFVEQGYKDLGLVEYAKLAREMGGQIGDFCAKFTPA